VKDTQFASNSAAQKAAIWGQVILNSCIPIILFFLAYALTASYAIAWITAWISVVHIGLILASTYLLTEGIALFFFYLFLLFFYKSFRAYGEREMYKNKSGYGSLACAALLLGIFTWIRPMGEFFAIISLLILLLCAQDSWKRKLNKMLLFALIFFTSIAPWYIRNYQRSGKLFFCPMFGLYLNAFTAPRIVRDISGLPLGQTWNTLQQQLALRMQEEARRMGYTDFSRPPQSLKQLPIPELLAGDIAWPIILAHPVLACMEWLEEVGMTAFDLYSYQLITFIKNNFKSDPLEAFLGENA
jgi:hypothetical protein